MKKAFTLMELIIVIGILAVILGTSYIFRGNSESEKTKYGKKCADYIIQEILNQDNNIKKNKTINSGDEALLIRKVTIEVRSHDGLYMTIFNEKGEISETKILINDGTYVANYIPNKNKYKIKANYRFSIHITKDEYSVKDGILEVCNPGEGGNCVEVIKINYDKASNRFKTSTCYPDNNDHLGHCTNRE